MIGLRHVNISIVNTEEITRFIFINLKLFQGYVKSAYNHQRLWDARPQIVCFNGINLFERTELEPEFYSNQQGSQSEVVQVDQNNWGNSQQAEPANTSPSSEDEDWDEDWDSNDDEAW